MFPKLSHTYSVTDIIFITHITLSYKSNKRLLNTFTFFFQNRHFKLNSGHLNKRVCCTPFDRVLVPFNKRISQYFFMINHSGVMAVSLEPNLLFFGQNEYTKYYSKKYVIKP